MIIGFNVRPVGNAAQVADQEGVEIRTYSVIYKIVEDLRDAMEGLLEAVEVEEAVGTVEVRATFKASRVGTIAGCYVTDGTVRRGAQCRLVRDGTVVYDGRIGSLRRFKDDVREVTAGMECGIVLENYPDVKEGDVIEVYETKQVEQTLWLSFVWLLEIHLHFPDNGSLKGKRKELRSLKAPSCSGASAPPSPRPITTTSGSAAELTAALVGRDAGPLQERAAASRTLRRSMFRRRRPCGMPIWCPPDETFSRMADRMRRVNEAVREVVSARIAEGLKTRA